MRAPGTDELVNVLGVHVAAIDMECAIQRIAQALQEQASGYVCLTGVHGVMEAHRQPELREVFADSLLTAPDGIPTVWLGHWYGYAGMRQITGPDLMLQVLSREEFAGCRHFLYGGKPGVAEELQQTLSMRMPDVCIVGTYTPPFRDLSAEEEDELIAMIQCVKADIVWVGISTPKQERFMHRICPRMERTLMFGVGAAFDFHTGRIQDCPQWVKRAGLQWLDRLLQDPRHLWKRYLRNNPAFVWHIALQLSGLRRYPPAAKVERTSAPILRKVESDL